MLPGYVAGFYDYDACHVDLLKLANFAQARLIHAEAIGINTKVSVWLEFTCFQTVQLPLILSTAYGRV